MRARVGIAVGLMILGVTSPASAAFEEVASGSDSGDYPIATASDFVRHPKAFRVEVFAQPAQPVELTVDRMCWRGSRNRGREMDFTFTPPFLRVFDTTLRRPDDCSISAWVEPAGEQTSGRIAVELYAKRRG